MDWAEELKMSLRKTTARKGRRSKSRDLLKETSTGNGSTSSGVTSPNVRLNKEISIDITLDLQNSDTVGATTSTATPHSSTTFSDNEIKRPPVRLSGGWADTGQSVIKSSKSKKSSFDDDRFQHANFKSTTSSPPMEEDIPVIPDLDDVKDEVLLNEIVEPPSISVNRVVTLKELNSDLLSQHAFSGIKDVDLSILTCSLQSQETLDEADEIWEWEKLFTDVIAEINLDKPNTAGNQKIEIGPDEVPPLMHN